jgi:hypothetical protein
VQAKAQLLQVIATARPGGGLADTMHRRQAESKKQSNDRDYDY